MANQITDQEWFDSFKQSLKAVQICLDIAVPLIKSSGVLTEENCMPNFFGFRQWVHNIRKTKEVDPSLCMEDINEWFDRIQIASRWLDKYAEKFKERSKIRTLFKEVKNDLSIAWVALDEGRGRFEERPVSSEIDDYLSYLEASFKSD